MLSLTTTTPQYPSTLIPLMSGQHLALILRERQGAFNIGVRETTDPGPGEILVKVRSAALNPTDSKIQKRGIYVNKFPAVLGSDGSGVVEKVGEGVTRFDPGDDVFFHGAYDDNDLSTFQQYSIVVVDFAAKIPDSLSYDQAATIPLGISTAAIGLYGKVNGLGLVAPWKHGGHGKYRGMPIMIFGGAGSVGNYAIQLAKMSGFSPIITTASLKHTSYLKHIGATHVIDRYLAPSALKQAVERITTAPINVIYDTVSIRETQEAAWQLLGPQGRLVLTLPSVIDKQSDDRRGIVLTNGNPHTEDNWETGRQLWVHLARWLEKGDIVPNHVETISGGLKGISAALERFENHRIAMQKALFLEAKQGEFVVSQRPIPAPGPGQLLVKIYATGVNPVDWKIQQSGAFVGKFPAVLGEDIAGEVVDVGQGVSNFAKGERVLAHANWSNDEGGFQQYALTTAAFTARIPVNLTYDQAATVPLAFDTALVGLYSEVLGAGLVPPWTPGGQAKYSGSPILVIGGSSSVGSYVIQLARLSGFSPIITTASRIHEDYLKSLGATNIVHRHADSNELKSAITDTTPVPIKVVYDAISLSETQQVAFEVLAPDGTLVLTLQSIIKEGKKIVATYGNPHIAENQVLCQAAWSHLEKWLHDGIIKVRPP
ncbi:hypothetical protein ID866_8114 [Astraeus odoratus]|nr:hypothetical protein ID866_8114 [Astraeus odoratus]